MKSGAGFTLVEMVIVVGIVSLLAATAIANFPRLRGTIALERESGRLALAIRKAQQFSSGVRRFDKETFTANPNPGPNGCEGIFDAQFPAFGVAIQEGSGNYGLYADPDCNREPGSYPNTSNPIDLIETFSMQNAHIEQICINADALGCNAVGELSVWHIRPGLKPRPGIMFVPTPDTFLDAEKQSARIVIKSEDGLTRSVVVRTTGQVSVENF